MIRTRILTEEAKAICSRMKRAYLNNDDAEMASIEAEAKKNGWGIALSHEAVFANPIFYCYEKESTVKAYRVWATRQADTFNEQTFNTLEDAINEAEWLWKNERYEDVHVSTEEWLDEDGCPSDHNIVWQNGEYMEER